MSKDLRRLAAVVSISALMFGCHCGLKRDLRCSQRRAYEVYQQNQQLAGQLDAAQASAEQLAAERQALEQQLMATQESLDIANKRVNNLTTERGKLHEKYEHLLTTLPTADNPLGGSATNRFEDLARRYPNFNFDPKTGVSRFDGELLFSTGSDEVSSEGRKLLKEFAQIINSGDARQFNVLVVGHTDDQPIVRAGTRSRHPSNWDLSAHRATSVVKILSDFGVAEQRMGVAGYSKFQPAVANASDSGRKQNRRCEIFILAPDAPIAGRATGVRR